MVPKPPDESDPLELSAGLDKLLEHRLRLTICVLLSRSEELSFARLKQLTKETDGNLGANLRKLEQEGLLAVRKQFENRRPVSWYSLTAGGRQRLKAHLDGLSRLIDQARPS